MGDELGRCAAVEPDVTESVKALDQRPRRSTLPLPIDGGVVVHTRFGRLAMGGMLLVMVVVLAACGGSSAKREGSAKRERAGESLSERQREAEELKSGHRTLFESDRRPDHTPATEEVENRALSTPLRRDPPRTRRAQGRRPRAHPRRVRAPRADAPSQPHGGGRAVHADGSRARDLHRPRVAGLRPRDRHGDRPELRRVRPGLPRLGGRRRRRHLAHHERPCRVAHVGAASDGMDSNAIGSLTVDPNDASGNTIYAGTGEPNGSGDSEAGVGLYKSTNGGTAGSSSQAAARSRSIARSARSWSTRRTRTTCSSAPTSRATAPPAPTAAAVRPRTPRHSASTSRPMAERPSTSSSPVRPTRRRPPRARTGSRAASTSSPWIPRIAPACTRRSSAMGSGAARRTSTVTAPGTRSSPRATRRTPSATARSSRSHARAVTRACTRATAPTTRPSPSCGAPTRPTRASRSSPTARRTSVPGRTCRARPNGTPGYTSYNYCQNGQCGYDDFVEVDPTNPDVVWLGGSMAYDELATPGQVTRSNGRAVVRSTNAGVSFTDMTDDARTPAAGMHPDQHAIVFDPKNTGIALIGSDGGVVRTNGTFVDKTADCASRNLPKAADVADCQRFLSSIPQRIDDLNDGLRTLQFQSLTPNPRTARATSSAVRRTTARGRSPAHRSGSSRSAAMAASPRSTSTTRTSARTRTSTRTSTSTTRATT